VNVHVLKRDEAGVNRPLSATAGAHGVWMHRLSVRAWKRAEHAKLAQICVVRRCSKQERCELVRAESFPRREFGCPFEFQFDIHASLGTSE